jgi:hypothetical protein
MRENISLSSFLKTGNLADLNRRGLDQTTGSVTPAKGFGSSGWTRMRTCLRFLMRLLIGRATNVITNGCDFQYAR